MQSILCITACSSPGLQGPSSGPFHSFLPDFPASSVSSQAHHPHGTQIGPSEIRAKLKTLCPASGRAPSLKGHCGPTPLPPRAPTPPQMAPYPSCTRLSARPGHHPSRGTPLTLSTALFTTPRGIFPVLPTLTLRGMGLAILSWSPDGIKDVGTEAPSPLQDSSAAKSRFPPLTGTRWLRVPHPQPTMSISKG